MNAGDTRVEQRYGRRMRVMFCHGLESGPHGRKYHALVDAGFEVTSPDCRNRDLGARIEIIADAIVAQPPSIVVGSSFGGIASLLALLVAARRGARVHGHLLCAPALQLEPPPGFAEPVKTAAPTTEPSRPCRRRRPSGCCRRHQSA